MCTVSYIPPFVGSSFILTSNRDEMDYRPTAPPEIYDCGAIKVCFPMDTIAGGSWIAVNNKGRVCCLLNGAFKKHTKEKHHTESRGKVLIETISAETDVDIYYNSKDLKNVEPFTIITIELKDREIFQFNEFIWDGKNKHFKNLDRYQKYIWQSVTLYDEEIRSVRKDWFNNYLDLLKNEISPKKIYQFHSGNYTENKSINLIMERGGGLRTVSITQIISNRNQLLMKYTDLLNNDYKEVEI